MEIPKENRGLFTASGSTFMHEIFLDPAKNSKESLIGYSKNPKYSEPANKVLLLQNIIYRVLPKYFEKMLWIDFYIKKDPSKDFFVPKNRKLVLRIFKHEIDVVEKNDIVRSTDFKGWLMKLIDRLNTNEEIGSLKPKWERKNHYLNILNAHMRNATFNSPDELLNFCNGERKRGMCEDTLRNFYSEYVRSILNNLK